MTSNKDFRLLAVVSSKLKRDYDNLEISIKCRKTKDKNER
jgi:hypothetical protein